MAADKHPVEDHVVLRQLNTGEASMSRRIPISAYATPIRRGSPSYRLEMGMNHADRSRAVANGDALA